MTVSDSLCIREEIFLAYLLLRIVPNFGIPRSCVIAKFNETCAGINMIREIVTDRHPGVPLNFRGAASYLHSYLISIIVHTSLNCLWNFYLPWQ